MGTVYATVDDLEARWRPLSEVEQTRAGVLLADASTRIRAASPSVDERIAAGQLDPEAPRIVAVEMVKRAMLSPVDEAPVVQAQQTAGPFSQSVRFVNPTGDLYLTKEDRRLLRGGGQAYTVSMAPPGFWGT